MYGERVGLAAGILLIFSLEHAKYSHYLMPDAPMLLFLALAFLFIWQIYKKGKTQSYILAGLMAGLAMATKYGGQLLFLPLFVAHLFHALENKKPLWSIFFSFNVVLSVAFFILGFLAGCPYSVLDFPTFWRDFRWQSQHLLTAGHFGSSTAQPAWLFYIFHGFRENVGKFSQILVLGGVVAMLIRRRRADLILLSYPLVLFLLIGTWKTSATRYLLPAAPFFILIAAYFLDLAFRAAQDFIARARPKLTWFSRRQSLLFWAGTGIFVLSSAINTVYFDYSLTQPDTRTVAAEWISSRIPQRSRIALENYGPPISRQKYRIIQHAALGLVDLDYYARRKAEYIVTSDIMSSRFTDYPKEFPQEAAFYRSLEEKAVLLETFEPKRDELLKDLHNPTLKIYKLSNCPNPSFPGNFTRYFQRVRLERTNDGRWVLQSHVAGQGFLRKGEKVKNPYVRIRDDRGKDLVNWVVRGGEIAPPDFELSGETIIPELPAGSLISIGYEYSFSPSPAKLDLPAVLRKESVLKENIEPAALGKKELNFLFIYSALPGTRGDDYFQTVILAKTSSSWDFSSFIFGGELRFGDDYVLNPWAKIRDAEGREVKRLILFPGKVGSVEAKRRGPLRRSIKFPALPEPCSISVGYEYYYDRELPDKAGGPEELDITPPFLSPKKAASR
jgi:hypothetical protein